MALGRWGETIRQDLRHGLRQLRLSPGVAHRARIEETLLRERLMATLSAGFGLAFWLGRSASALLYGLKPYDPPAAAVAIALVAAVGIAASYGPALRAARLHPMDALREE